MSNKTHSSIKLTYNQFRSKFNGSGLKIDKIGQLWTKYKENKIKDSDLTKINIKQLILTVKKEITPQQKKVQPRRVSLIRKSPTKTVTPALSIDVNYISQQHIKIARLILWKLPADEILGVCSINKHFKEKVCTDYFWKLYIDKMWGTSINRLNKVFIKASEKGHADVVKILLADKRVDPSAHYNDAIILAANNGHTKVVKVLLVDKRVDPAAQDNSAIGVASREGHIEVVKLLLADKRVDPAADNNYAIINAYLDGHIEVVKLLLEDKRVNPTANDNFIMRMASGRGQVEVIKLLLEDKRVDPTDNDNYAVRMASLRGHLKVVKLIREHQKLRGSKKTSIADFVSKAVTSGDKEVIKFFLHQKLSKDSKVVINIPLPYTKGRKIGRGTYGNVYKGITLKNEYVAIKEISIGKEASSFITKDYFTGTSIETTVMPTNIFLKEVSITELMSRHNIGPKFKGAYICEGKKIGVILLELWSKSFYYGFYNDKYCLDKSLIDKLKRKVDKLHKLGYVHNDITPYNILIRGDVDEDDQIPWVSDITLTDFGITQKASAKFKGMEVLYKHHKRHYPDYFKQKGVTLAKVKQNPILLDDAFFWTYKNHCKGKKPWPLERGDSDTESS